MRARGERVAPAMLAEDDAVGGKPDIFGFHDLVGLPVLQHAVLVDAGFVGEGVGADDRLVARRRVLVTCASVRLAAMILVVSTPVETP